MKERLALLLPILIFMGILLYWLRPSDHCVSASDKYGIKVPVCPNGTPKQIVSVWGRQLIRGGDGEVEVSVSAHYTTEKADEATSTDLKKFKVELFLVDGAGTETPLPAQGKWQKEAMSRKASIKLPIVDDGDYLLRTVVKSKLGESKVDIKLPLYAPARIHLLTDRPLYEPGNLVQFRALALRARDLTPIDNRPGTWIVRDPQGETLLEEKAPAGEWGVVAGDFPLSSDAEVGTWTVSWHSGADQESTSFLVEPFVLPRFRVESSSDKSFYQAGDKPELTGAVVYSSGAPVANASLEITWSASGAWPPPTEWMEGSALPSEGKTGADGRFTLRLPEVPADLRGRCTLSAHIAATDPAGDRVANTGSLLLSEDAIEVTAVTELDGGLVENTNNRVYLRVTDPNGFALGGAKINVKRAWAPGDEGLEGELDSDGVTRIQFDPGRPISVVVPPMPVRQSRQDLSGAASLTGLRDLVSNQEASMADQIAAESWLDSVRACAKWVQSDSQTTTVSFRVSSSGALSAATSEATPLSRCVASVIGKRSLPAGRDRLYAASVWVQSSDLPVLYATVSSSMSTPDSLSELVTEAAADARSCLPNSFEGQVPWILFWSTTAQSKKIEWSWMRDTGAGRPMPTGLDACIMTGLKATELGSAPAQSSIGIVRYSLSQPASQIAQLRPQATILEGYELTVSAQMGAREVGSTRLIMQPGLVPNLRLRATPVIANPGETIELAFFRGPDYQGDVPREIRMQHQGDAEQIKLADKAKLANFELPADAKGWYEFSADGARALVFVRSDEDLSVRLTPGQESYTPGSNASIKIETQIAGKGAKAAVGLFGVDNSLSQIASLRGPDDLGSIRPTIAMSEKAFGALDASALSLGRIQGAYAAEATILRVDSVPAPGETDRIIYESGETEFDPIVDLTDNFYIALAELHLQTRAWEASAKEGVTMTPKQMSLLWQASLKACKARGQDIVDGYGRALRLHWLPEDLLSLVDPAQVVADATRLPEDVENWQQWVMKEKP